MNRTLLSLGLCNNQIGDLGAQKLGEVRSIFLEVLLFDFSSSLKWKFSICLIFLMQVISRFPLNHEEIVERRKMHSSAPDRKSASVSISSLLYSTFEKP